jgi:hypothetical protein
MLANSILGVVRLYTANQKSMTLLRSTRPSVCLFTTMGKFDHTAEPPYFFISHLEAYALVSREIIIIIVEFALTCKKQYNEVQKEKKLMKRNIIAYFT